LSCRLTSQTILQSLKVAAPLLVDVAFFILFAMILFRCADSP